MRTLNIRRTYNSEDWRFKESSILEQDTFKSVNNDGVFFTYLNCDVASNTYELNPTFKKEAVHFIYPKDGEVTLKIEGDGMINLTCPAKTPSLFNSKPYLDNRFYFQTSITQDISILSIDYAQLGKLYRGSNFEDHLDHYYNFKDYGLLSISGANNVDRLPKLIFKILKLWKHPKHDTHLLRVAISELQYLLIQQYCTLSNHKILNDVEIEKIKKLPEIIINKIATRLKAEDIANQLDLQIDKLHLGCEAIYNTTITSLVNAIKLKCIAHRILTTKMTLAEIAYENGFSNRSYLYEIFEERFQCSPTDYRKKSLVQE